MLSWSQSTWQTPICTTEPTETFSVTLQVSFISPFFMLPENLISALVWIQGDFTLILGGVAELWLFHSVPLVPVIASD